MFRKNIGFTCAAVTVLALGIGANSAIFSLVNAFLFKPLMIQSPAALVGCYSRDAHKSEYRAFSYADYTDLRDQNGGVFSSLTAHNLAMVGVSEGNGNTTRRVFADMVASNYFATFGVPLSQGRAFTAEEERPGSAVPVAIVSYPYWEKSGSDPHILGTSIQINGRIYTIVGVAAQGFTGTTAMISPEVYLPLGVYESVVNDFDGRGRALAERGNHALLLVGRLRSGMTQKLADASLSTVAAQLASTYAEDKDQTFIVRPLGRMEISTDPANDSEIILPAALLLSVAAIVLLIASLNVANMMLARGTTRRREVAIRLALGASRRDILRQLLVEGLLLALAGGAAGLLLAFWTTGALVHSLAHLLPLDIVFSAAPDVRVLAATIGFCVLSTILFGLGPAWKLSRRDLVGDIKIGGGSDFQTGRLRGIFARRNLLVMGQISLSLVLLSAAGLFIRSSMQAARLEPGFRIQNEVVAEVDASLAGYNEARGREIYRSLAERLENTPGVESVSLAATIPFGMVSLGKSVQRSSDAPASASGESKPTEADCSYNVVSGRYFETLQIPLQRGRAFSAQDASGTGARVAILDQAAAEKLWPGGDAVGRSVRIGTSGGNEAPIDAQVVGVVGNVQEGVTGKHWPPHIYVPFGQAYQSDMQIHIRTAPLAPESEAHLLETVRGEIRAVDPNLPILALKTMRAHLDASFDLWIVRTGARIFMIFGGVALLLAAIGLYGVRAYNVAQRTREIGIRMALGASSSDAVRMMLREGLALMGVGAVIGLLLSVAVGKALSTLLYRVPSFDPVVLMGAPVILAVVSLIACYVPARRAALLDPMVALRDE
jgi:predicted permease